MGSRRLVVRNRQTKNINMKSLKFLPALLIAAGMFIACGGEHKEAASDTQTEQIAVVDTMHAYICPMNCVDSGSMEPGVCKVCGMDLVKNPDYKSDAAGAMPESAASATDTAAHDHDDHEGHNH